MVVAKPRLAVLQARQSHRAALRCLEQRPQTPTSFEWLPVPAGMLLGFTCEVYQPVENETLDEALMVLSLPVRSNNLVLSDLHTAQ